MSSEREKIGGLLSFAESLAGEAERRSMYEEDDHALVLATRAVALATAAAGRVLLLMLEERPPNRHTVCDEVPAVRAVRR